MKHPKNDQEQLFDPMLCPCQECRKIRKTTKEVEKLMKEIIREMDRRRKPSVERKECT